jgi:hypothetical protein
LVQAETDFNINLDGHGLASSSCWLEYPPAHCLNGFFIQSHPERAYFADVLRLAICTNDQPQYATPLATGLAGPF